MGMRRALVGLVVPISCFFLSSTARAADEASESATEVEAETRVHVWADMVFGFGKTAVVNQDIPTFGSGRGAYHEAGARFSSQNADVGITYAVIPGLVVGVEVPITHVTFTPSDVSARSVDVLGNVELNAELEKHVSKSLIFVPGLEVGLPTAQGDSELPPTKEVAEDPNTPRDQKQLDRFSAQRAAANARGWEENHLFSPDRLGFVPRVAFIYEGIHDLEVEPSIKAGMLVSTNGLPFEGDIIPGIRASYRFVPAADVGVRVWANIPIGGSLPEDESAIGVVEPQVRAHLGGFTPVLGVVLPFAGPISHPENVGVRLALNGAF